jgi:hypothetical protein
VGAFVTFNNEESARRCLEDYHGSDSWFSLSGYWFQPPQIRFNGTQRLTVTKAPDPSQVVWQNLELTTTQRLLRQTGVNVLLLGLLALSALCILVFVAWLRPLAPTLPSMRFCNTVLPALAFGKQITITFSLQPDDRLPNGLQLTYDPSDPTCSAQGRPRVRWTTTDNIAPITSPNHPNPCLNECLQSTGTCTFNAQAMNESFPLHIVVPCYCALRAAAVVGMQESLHALSLAARMDGQVCMPVAQQFVQLTLTGVAAAVLLVGLNVCLRRTAKGLALLEGHPTVSIIHASIAWVRALAAGPGGGGGVERGRRLQPPCCRGAAFVLRRRRLQSCLRAQVSRSGLLLDPTHACITRAHPPPRPSLSLGGCSSAADYRECGAARGAAHPDCGWGDCAIRCLLWVSFRMACHRRHRHRAINDPADRQVRGSCHRTNAPRCRLMPRLAPVQTSVVHTLLRGLLAPLSTAVGGSPCRDTAPAGCGL